MNAPNSNVTEVLQEDGVTAALDTLGGIQLADYELTERIGAGGYGEVWKATGPGGLPKAVKILYGERSGKHAEAELKALERMRDLRHPFLLSIERIEVVNSRLIVVTELADGNLSELYEQYRAKGQAGIPRDELLGMLRDSADALDFMFTEHGLQHLDIKPDNILLQGKHAKVGDFGLAKDINVTNVSVINGFTPMYAAPELFEGRPGRASDQYSLAIVYQMMLTGVPPFPGRTAAQLTVQHLRSQPDLTHLQPVDRPVVARALSKNANSRFDSCRHFIDELARRKASRSNRAFLALDEKPAVSSQTELVQTNATGELASMPAQESRPVNVEPVSTNQTRRRCVFIGAGGLAGTILQNLKKRVAGAENAVETGFLHLDTDRNAIKALRDQEDDDTTGLSPGELMAVQLRTSKQYRAARDMDLSWMSRRWLFNIPRSGLVEGIRPLGRLALCDHYEPVKAEVQRLLDDVGGTRTGDEGLDVYIVAATSGGTGSGMVNDLGVMLQSVIRDRGLQNIQVHGLLLHVTGATRNVSDVQDANTVSMLQELRHLQTPGLQTPRGFEDSHATRQLAAFDNTWVAHLGDGLNDLNLPGRIEGVIGYLSDCALSVAQLDFSAWHEKQPQSADEPTQVRLLGAGSQNADSYQAASDQCGNLCAATLRHWAATERTEEIEQQLAAELADTERILTDLKLTSESSHNEVVEMLRGSAGQAVEQFATAVVAAATAEVDPVSGTRAQLLDYVSRTVSETNEGSATLVSVVSGVRSSLAVATEECSRVLDKHLKMLLNKPQRIQSSSTAASFAEATLNRSIEECIKQLSGIETMFTELTTEAKQDSPFPVTADTDAAAAARDFCRQYCVLLSYQAIYQCFVSHLRTVSGTVQVWIEKISKTREELLRIADLCLGDSDVEPMPGAVVDAFDQRLRADQPDLLSKAVAVEKLEPLKATLRSAATGFLVAAIEGSTGTSSADGEGAGFPANAWPGLRGLGGRRRVVGLLPEAMNEAEWKKRLREEFGDCVAVRKESRGAISVVCEIEGVPVESLLARLTHANPHIDEIASRVHTRVDIDW